jgi:WD40 repeat protein/energy-coupling factor transporter ATP-binding protein EcfA2
MSTVDTRVLAPNPFPGLRPFKIEESHLFFGREGQSDEVLLKLSKSRFVGVIGPSGSGKSSFIYCGVMPILYGGFLTDASPDWEVIVTRPGSGPMDNMAESLVKNNPDYIAADPEEKKIKRTIIATLLRSSSLGLVEAIEQSRRKANVNYLVLVDQFEELFRFKDSTDPNSVNETLAFVNLLMEAVNYPDAPIYVAITMRSDFIGDCAQFPELTRKINDSHYLIPQMTRDQKRRAIEGPVAVGNAKITPRLSQQLLNDLGDNPDQLPILQHALMRTWSYWSRYRDYDEEPLDLKHYEAIGTMAEALSMHANEAFDELTEDQKRICEVMFKAITEKRGENFGIRRPTRLNEIAAIADVTEDEVAQVLEKFREPGRSLVTPAFGTPLSSKSMVDISHESLMRIWVRLKNWVDDEADAVQMYLRLAEAASQYQVGKAGLWRPPDLQLALNWQAKHKPTLVWAQRYNPAFERTMIFLEYSKKEFETEQRIKELEQKRKLRNARITALVLASATVISLCFLVYAFYQKTQADKALEVAEAERQRADEQRKLAVANAEEANRQAKLAQEQKDIADQQRILAQQNAEEALRAKALAEQKQREAEEQRQLAQRNEARAKEQERLAKAAEAEATRARDEATRQRYIATAKQMALKSKEVGRSDKELEAIMAQQAFAYNTTYAGYAYDNDIYGGLFKALKAYEDESTMPLYGHKNGAARALVTRKGQDQIYSGGSDGKILKWAYTNDKWVAETLVGDRSDYHIYTMDVSPDGKWLAAGGEYALDGTINYIELYDLHNLAAGPKKVNGYKGAIENISFSPDNNGFFARDNAGHSVRFASITSTDAREVIASKEKINFIELSHDGKRIAGAGDNGDLLVWDVANYQSRIVFKNGTTGLTSVAFAPDDRRLIIGDEEGIVKVVIEGSTLAPRVLSGHTSPVEHIIFNHAGTFMATCSKDKTVRLWNTDKNFKDQPIVLDDHGDWVWSAAFTPDDTQLLVGMHGTAITIHAWPTRIEAMSTKLCDYVGRNMTRDEWEIFVGGDIEYETTCPNKK